MPQRTCPHCGAALDDAFLTTAGEEFDCPACQYRIRLSAVQAAADAEPSPSDDAAAEDAPGRLQCRTLGDRWVLMIPPGSNRLVRSLGCFAFVWIGFISVHMVAMIGGMVKSKEFGSIPFLLLFYALFFAVGLLMLYFWIRGRFGKTQILIEPGRLVIQFSLFGRDKMTEFELTETSRAELVVSYTQNDSPVYAISVSTAGKPAKFGTFLAEGEKDWVVERINQLLAPKTATEQK